MTVSGSSHLKIMSPSETGSVGINATLLDCSCCGWRVIGKPNRDSANIRSKCLSEVPLQCLQQDLGTLFFCHDCVKWGEPMPCCLWLPFQPFFPVLGTLPGFRYSENSSSLCWVHTKTKVFSTYYTWEECFFSLSRERHWIFSFLQLPGAKSHLGTERRKCSWGLVWQATDKALPPIAFMAHPALQVFMLPEHQNEFLSVCRA